MAQSEALPLPYDQILNQPLPPLPPEARGVADVLSNERADELGDLSPWFTHHLVSEALNGSSGVDPTHPHEDVYSRPEVEARVERQYEQVVQLYAPLIAGWATFVMDTKERIQNSQVVAFPRDAYLPAVAYKALKAARGMKSVVAASHISRTSLGVKDEIAHASGEVGNRLNHFDLAEKYFQHTIVKGTQGRVAIIMDSLPYGYMLELLQDGTETFIVQKGNVGSSWRNGAIPDNMRKGLAKVYDVTMLPISFYSHTWGSQPDGRELRSVPGFLNIIVEEMFPRLNIPIPEDYLTILSTISEGVESTFDPHGTVQGYKEVDGHTIIPILPKVGELSRRLHGAAKRAVTQHIRSVINNREYGLDRRGKPATAKYYEDIALHLAYVMDLVIQTKQDLRWNKGVLVYGGTPPLSKKGDFLDYAHEKGDTLFSAVNTARGALHLP